MEKLIVQTKKPEDRRHENSKKVETPTHVF
jgi:hypothetical protein